MRDDARHRLNGGNLKSPQPATNVNLGKRRAAGARARARASADTATPSTSSSKVANRHADGHVPTVTTRSRRSLRSSVMRTRGESSRDVTVVRVSTSRVVNVSVSCPRFIRILVVCHGRRRRFGFWRGRSTVTRRGVESEFDARQSRLWTPTPLAPLTPTPSSRVFSRSGLARRRARRAPEGTRWRAATNAVSARTRRRSAWQRPRVRRRLSSRSSSA